MAWSRRTATFSHVIQRIASRSSLRWTALAGVCFIAVYFLTLTAFTGDAQVYVHDILAARASGNLSGLFEFGHVLWRPLGYVIFRALQWADPGADPRILANIALLIPSFAGGLICALLFFQVAMIVSASRWVAFVTSLALICTNSFLNYADSGSAYVAALALFTFSVWLLMREPVPASMFRIAAAGCALAGSILLWFPFITVAPGVLVIVLLWGHGEFPELRPRMIRGIQLTAITAALTLAVYCVAFRLNGHTSLSEVGPWIRDSAHGWHQTANAVRFVFGLPRSFLDLGNDGILFKRYLWHDPYARVSTSELIRGSLLKLAAFYAVLAYVTWRLAADRNGRLVLAIVAAALLPLLFFAIVLFEPGSPERYLPLFPFVAMAIAYTLSRPGLRAAQVVLAALLIIAASGLVWTRSVWEQGRHDNLLAGQIRGLKPLVNDHSIVWVMMPIDPVITYASVRPLNAANLDTPLQIHYLVETGMANARQWQRKFAHLSLRAWEQSGTVLVSNQVFAARPERPWNWTEGDVPGVRWIDFPAFFSRLQRGRATSNGEGFSEIAGTEENRRVLDEIAAGGAPVAGRR
jgi:hypothetical protein